MKKLSLIFVLLTSCSFGFIAQSNGSSDPQLINKAIQLLNGADCLDILSDKADGAVSTISTCFARGFVKEVFIYKVCNGNK